MAQILQNIRNDIWNVIGDESRLVGKLFAKIEQKTGKSRYQAAVMLAIVICMLLIVSPGAGLFLLEAGTTEPITTWMEGWHNQLNRKAAKGHNGFHELLELLIAEQSVMGTLIQQVLSGNVTVGDLRRVNKVYAEKQQRVCPIYG
ncbi:hypothetical protein T12_1211 [Trichinella patagoniensis]|uniref:Uncharacterized protein n=1 Tax=Trichinella patagoniensis TaxID=990121 RepID=A0A0V0ZB23_9BILA|nr:hypothetical protein T12_1211 [Trichinella patagoniensis]